MSKEQDTKQWKISLLNAYLLIDILNGNPDSDIRQNLLKGLKNLIAEAEAEADKQIKFAKNQQS